MLPPSSLARSLSYPDKCGIRAIKESVTFSGGAELGLFSPAQPWAIFFHPPPTPIALQSLTRDAPFPKWRRRDAVFAGPYIMILLSLLVLLQRDAFGFREHERRSEASA